jgi:hypothetical protein
MIAAESLKTKCKCVERAFEEEYDDQVVASAGK